MIVQRINTAAFMDPSTYTSLYPLLTALSETRKSPQIGPRKECLPESNQLVSDE